MPTLTLVETIPDVLYEIERGEHANVRWDEPIEHGSRNVYSGWIADAGVEGSPDEMIEIAQAIRARSGVSFVRCAVLVEAAHNKVRFWSPRNSSKDGVCTLAEADALADVIEAKLGERA